jgi:hypothetical protein
VEGFRPSRRSRRLLTLVLLAVITIAPLTTGVASAGDGDNVNVIFDTSPGGIGTWIGVPGDANDGTTGGDGSGHVPHCVYQLDRNADGTPKWPMQIGDSLYMWFWLVCDGVRDVAPDLLEVTGGAIADQPATRILAQQAYRFLPVPAPRVSFNPADGAVVGVPTWFWVDGQTWGSRTATIGLKGLSVVVRAKATSVTWRFQGETPLHCATSGKPYDESRAAAEQQTDCSRIFRRSSANRAGNALVASATTTWRIEWQGNDGTRGSLPTLQRTTAFRLPVAEVQTVVTRSQ